jgi:hypothetical protein
MIPKKSLTPVERILRDHVAEPALQALVDAGCNRDELISALGLAFLTNESWKELAGMNLRGFKATIARIRDCAGVVERLNRSDLIYRVSIEQPDPRFVGLHEPPTIPERLRAYANLLDTLPSLYGPKRKIRGHVWKAWVIAIVMTDTKKPHDREVASIMAAVLDDSGYSVGAHQAWRLKHSNVIEMTTKKLLEHRRKNRPWLSPTKAQTRQLKAGICRPK